MLAINVFVLPIAFGGLLHFPDGSVDADTFVLTLPMAEKHELLALLVFIGGLSAATGMVIVETIALSTMVCNDLVMPVLLRLRGLRLNERRDLTGLLLGIRRGAIVLILLLGYLYFKLAGEAYALVSIGLISFAAVAQFAPAMLGGIFWKGGTRRGALCGACSPASRSGSTRCCCPRSRGRAGCRSRFLEHGPFGIELLRAAAAVRPRRPGPDHARDDLEHDRQRRRLRRACRCRSSQSADEHRQASVFVDVFKQTGEAGGARFWRGTASVPELLQPAGALPRRRAARTLRSREYARAQGLRWPDDALVADAELVHYVEVQLAGAIGAASARVMVASVVKEEALTIDEVREILDEASQVVVYSHQLEQKSRELEAATAELREANERLKELDRLKDDFVSTVTHELRTPLTSIRAFSEILLDDPDVEPAQRKKFLGIITKEAERLTRLINQVLDLAKIESGNGRMGRIRSRHEGGHRGHARRHGPAVQGEERRRRGAAAREGVRRHRRPRPHDPGHAQPAVQRGEVLRRRERPGRGRAGRTRRLRCASTCATTAAASARRTTRSSSSKFRQVGDTLTDKPHGTRPRAADQPPDRRALRRPDVGGEHAGERRLLLVHAAADRAAAET